VGHDPDIEGFGQERAGGDAPVAPGGVSGLLVPLVEDDGPGIVDLGEGEEVCVGDEVVEEEVEMVESDLTGVGVVEGRDGVEVLDMRA
jgi:hypothetical protein